MLRGVSPKLKSSHWSCSSRIRFTHTSSYKRTLRGGKPDPWSRRTWRVTTCRPLQTSQGKCIPQAPGGFECHLKLVCVQDGITKSDTKLFVKQKLIVQITLTSSLCDANLDALAFVTLGLSSQVRHTPYLVSTRFDYWEVIEMEQTMSAARKYLTDKRSVDCEFFEISEDAQGFIARTNGIDVVTAWLVSPAKEVFGCHSILINRDWRIDRDQKVTGQLKKAVRDYCKENNLNQDTLMIGELSVLIRDKGKAAIAACYHPISGNSDK